MATRRFTREEVAKHNTPEDAWIIIDDVVFNITKFLKFHPGGRAVLAAEAGRDASENFWASHDKSIFQKYKKRLAVGVIRDSKADGPPPKLNPTAKRFGEMVPFGDPSWYQRFSSPFFNDSHRKFRAYVRDLIEREITPHVAKWEEAYEMPKSVYKVYGAAGLYAATVGMAGGYDYVPELAHLKPKNFDYFHEMILADELARCGSGGVPWAVSAGLTIGLPPVLNYGTKAQKEKVVRECVLGNKVICLAISEPWAASDVRGLRTTAKRVGDHYIVNGAKKWITNGLFADFFTVACRTGKRGELTLLLLEKDMPGITCRHMKCQGVWSSGTTFIDLDNVKVPVANRIGEEHKGFKLIMHNFNHERLWLVWTANRLSRMCYEEAFKYAQKRKTFGKRLMDHQLIRFKLGEMARQIEASHAWAESITHQMNTMSHDEAQSALGDVIALAKVHSTRVLELCAREALHIFGGAGYVRTGVGARVERIYRDVRAYAIPGGSEEILEDFAVKFADRHFLKYQKAQASL